MSIDSIGHPIRGLVGASCPGGFSPGASGSWSLVFYLVAYRQMGSIQRSPLRCEVPMSREEMDQWMSRITPYSILEGTLGGTNERGAALLSNLSIYDEDDAELQAIGVALQQPVAFQSPVLGELLLDRAMDAYMGEVLWRCKPTRLSIELQGLDDPRSPVAIAESLFDSQEAWDDRARAFAADKLLEVKNGSWLGDDEEALTRGEFLSRLTLETLCVDSDGFNLWYADGDLFWGHAVLVSGNLRDGLLSADIHG